MIEWLNGNGWCEWWNGYEKLSHVGPVGCEEFYNSFKTLIAKDE